MKSFVLGLGLGAAVLGFWGCSSSPSDGSPTGTDAGSSGGSSGGSTGSSGSSGSSGDGGASSGDGGSDTPYFGVVSVTQTLEGGDYSSVLGGVFFKRAIGPDPDPTCPNMTIGPCVASACTSDTGTGMSKSPTVGSLTFTGGMVGTLVLQPIDNNGLNEYASGLNAQVYAPGQTFTVTASGGDIAAFTGTSAPAPGDIQLTAPLPDSSGLEPIFSIDGTKDLEVSWTGGTPGSQVEVGAINGDGMTMMTCIFDAGAGTGTVPQAALVILGPSDGTVGTGAFFSVRPRSATTFTTKDASIDFYVYGTQIGAGFKSAP